MRKLIKRRPPWKLLPLSSTNINNGRINYVSSPVMYGESYIFGSMHKKIKVYKFKYSLCNTIKINNTIRKCKNHKQVETRGWTFWNKQIICYSVWLTEKLSKMKYLTIIKLRKKFNAIYQDRDIRYNLYFTQGITDPFGPEANTYLSLTKQ